MANNLYNSLNGAHSQPDLVTEMQSLRANPLQFLMQRRLNIPPEIQNDPRAITQYWLNTGQMTQSQCNELQSLISSRTQTPF